MPHEVGVREENVEETGDSHNQQRQGTDPKKDKRSSCVDGAYKKRVMDDLDALLADLQNTTAHISSYQNSQQGTLPQEHAQQHHQHHQQHQHQQQQQQQQTHGLYQSVPVPVNNTYNVVNSGGYPPPPPPEQLSHQYHQEQQQQQQQQYFAHHQRQQQQQYPNQYPPPPPPPNHHQQQQQHQYHHQHHQQLPLSAQNPNQQFPPPPPLPPGHDHVYRTIDSVALRAKGQGQGEVVTVRRESYNSSGGNSGGSTPPPLPPPPPSEVLDSLAYAHAPVPGVYTAKPFQPPGQQQQQQQQHHFHQHQHQHQHQQPPPPQPQPLHHQSSFDAPPQLPSDVVQHRPGAKGRGERMSALSNNLSELDQLLQDLNSAQFMAEVERKSSVNDVPVVINGGHSKQGPPPVAPKPGQRNSVDTLLDDLEGTPRFPVDPMYQEIGGVGAVNHSQQHQHQYHHHNAPSSQDHYSSSTSSSPYPPQSASVATKELDDLMMSLSEFKLQNKDTPSNAVFSDPNNEPAYAKPMKSRTTSAGSNPTSPNNETMPMPPPPQGENGQLESMLGDLQSDMNKQGVNTKKKGVCAACNKPIVGQLIAALGQTWHIEHFTCAHCEEPLGARNFYERDGRAYCETDYHHLFAPKCAYCNGPIVDKCITALEKMWHPEHFFCAECGHPFGEEDFHEMNGKAYCKNDYFQMFAPRCGGCAHPIMDNFISALTRQWHPQCFVCWDCRAPFGNGSFFDYEGLPYCENHYHAKKGSLCASCDRPITGRCITAMFKKFHPEHFVCAFCLKQLNKGTFKEQNDKPYCHPCFVKLFG